MRNHIRRGLAAAGAVLLGQLAWAIWRPLPTFADLDANGFHGPEDGDPLRVLVLGDSTCTGCGLDDPADIWVQVLSRRLAAHGYRVEVVSFAVGGSKASDIVRDQLQAAVATGGDIAIVSVGGNDALRGVRLGEFATALDTVVRELSSVVEIVALSGVGDMGTVPRLPPLVAAAARRRGRALNTVHQQVAARHGALVADQWAWVADRFRDRTVFAPDLFHPNAAGHAVWAEVAYDLIYPALGRSQGQAVDRSTLGVRPG